jgi:hypothetical protein
LSTFLGKAAAIRAGRGEIVAQAVELAGDNPEQQR